MAQAGSIPAHKLPMSRKWLIDVEQMSDVIRNKKTA
jgi:hypothetical protein